MKINFKTYTEESESITHSLGPYITYYMKVKVTFSEDNLASSVILSIFYFDLFLIYFLAHTDSWQTIHEKSEEVIVSRTITATQDEGDDQK